jgi:hypothetical protein
MYQRVGVDFTLGHNHKWYTLRDSSGGWSYNDAGSTRDLTANSGVTFERIGLTTTVGVSGLASTFYTNNATPYYHKVIAATKDAY